MLNLSMPKSDLERALLARQFPAQSYTFKNPEEEKWLMHATLGELITTIFELIVKYSEANEASNAMIHDELKQPSSANDSLGKKSKKAEKTHASNYQPLIITHLNILLSRLITELNNNHIDSDEIVLLLTLTLKTDAIEPISNATFIPWIAHEKVADNFLALVHRLTISNADKITLLIKACDNDDFYCEQMNNDIAPILPFEGGKVMQAISAASVEQKTIKSIRLQSQLAATMKDNAILKANNFNTFSEFFAAQSLDEKASFNTLRYQLWALIPSTIVKLLTDILKNITDSKSAFRNFCTLINTSEIDLALYTRRLVFDYMYAVNMQGQNKKHSFWHLFNHEGADLAYKYSTNPDGNIHYQLSMFIFTSQKRNGKVIKPGTKTGKICSDLIIKEKGQCLSAILNWPNHNAKAIMLDAALDMNTAFGLAIHTTKDKKIASGGRRTKAFYMKARTCFTDVIARFCAIAEFTDVKGQIERDMRMVSPTNASSFFSASPALYSTQKSTTEVGQELTAFKQASK